MTRRTLTTVIMIAACACSMLSAARAGESALDACRKWTGEGAGMQYKCFDCLRRVGSWPNQHWVNTCANNLRHQGYGQGWGFYR